MKITILVKADEDKLQEIRDFFGGQLAEINEAVGMGSDIWAVTITKQERA